jgi:hypothetical protein
MAAAVPIILAAATVATTAVSIDNSNKVRESADDERRRALAESKKQKAEAQAKLDQEKIDQEAITTRTDREQGNAAQVYYARKKANANKSSSTLLTGNNLGEANTQGTATKTLLGA